MSRGRNKRVGLADGSRVAVASAERVERSNPTRWLLSLACGHRVRFQASDQPRHVRCPDCTGVAVQACEVVGGDAIDRLERLAREASPGPRYEAFLNACNPTTILDLIARARSVSEPPRDEHAEFLYGEAERLAKP